MGKEEDSLTEGVKSKSVGENLLVPSDQGTYWRANGRRPRSRMSDGAVRFCCDLLTRLEQEQHHLNCRVVESSYIDY